MEIIRFNNCITIIVTTGLFLKVNRYCVMFRVLFKYNFKVVHRNYNYKVQKTVRLSAVLCTAFGKNHC